MYLIWWNVYFPPNFYFKGDNLIFKESLINEQIVATSCRLIDENGEQLGVVSTQDALAKAHNASLDLVLLNSSAEPVVCKIMDYGKFRYEQIKKEKEAKKNQKVVDIKEIQLSLTIGEHDVEYRIKQGIKFLEGGDKVKLTLRMRGRQQAFVKEATNVVNTFASKLCEAGVGSVDKPALVNGKNIIMIIAPKK